MPVVAGRGRSERASRAVEGVRRNVFGWLLWLWMPWPLRVQRTVYIIYYTQYVHLFTTPIIFTPHSCLTVRIPRTRSTLSCVSVRFPNIHITRPCDLRRHAYCAARSPVNHWPAPARRRRRRCSNYLYHTVWHRYIVIKTFAFVLTRRESTLLLS